MSVQSNDVRSFVADNVILRVRLANGHVRVLDPGSFNRPDAQITDHLEETFLLHGPPLFHWMLDQFPTRLDAQKAAGVSHSTLSRWVNSKVGKAFGQRRADITVYRSIWVGYPSPFPGMDRLCEEMYGSKESFLGHLIQRSGMRYVMRMLRRRPGFGLEDLQCDHEDLLAAADRVGIPKNTVRRWTFDQTYPSQWKALDGITRKILGMTWFEAVLFVRPLPRASVVPPQAIRSMLEMGTLQLS